MITSNPFPISPVFEWNYTCTKPIVINQGGTSGGKTYCLLQVLILKAAEEPNQVVTVVGQDIPNLKVGAMRTLSFVLNDSPYLASFLNGKPNKTERTWTLNNGSIIEFKSFEDEQDAKGGRRDYLFMNEANGISYDVYDQLQVRTSKQVFIDYNPTAPFWVHEKLIGRDDVQLFMSHYKHNPFLAKEIIQKIEAWKGKDAEKWKVYGLGLTGKTEGVIFKNVNWVSEFPEDLKRVSWGMDFGFTNDPTTLVRCGISDGELYAEKWVYDFGMTTPMINKALTDLGVSKKQKIIADSADPKTIRELKDFGWNVRGAKKGPDSVRFGIDDLKKYECINIVNCEKWKEEQINYVWEINKKTQKPTNKPIDDWNHLWDALRYGSQGLRKRRIVGAGYKN